MEEDINIIIEFLDNYLVKNNMQFISAPEANQILEEAGLLNDSIDKPGKSLRKLLRAGYFPHAYKNNGRWVIPCPIEDSFKLIRQEKNYAVDESNSRNLLQEDNNELKKKLEDARLEYKPDKVRYLLIAQARGHQNNFKLMFSNALKLAGYKIEDNKTNKLI